MAGNRRPLITKGKKRISSWTATVPQTGYSTLGGASVVIDSSFTTGINAPETVVRIRGAFNVLSDQVAAGEQPFGAVGICVVSDQAFAAGVASVPTPMAEADSDLWFLHQFWSCPFSLAGASGISNVSEEYVLDSKAMRKVTPDATLIVVVENAASGVGVFYNLNFRMLFKVA